MSTIEDYECISISSESSDEEDPVPRPQSGEESEEDPVPRPQSDHELSHVFKAWAHATGDFQTDQYAKLMQACKQACRFSNVPNFLILSPNVEDTPQKALARGRNRDIVMLQTALIRCVEDVRDLKHEALQKAGVIVSVPASADSLLKERMDPAHLMEMVQHESGMVNPETAQSDRPYTDYLKKTFADLEFVLNEIAGSINRGGTALPVEMLVERLHPAVQLFDANLKFAKIKEEGEEGTDRVPYSEDLESEEFIDDSDENDGDYENSGKCPEPKGIRVVPGANRRLGVSDRRHVKVSRSVAEACKAVDDAGSHNEATHMLAFQFKQLMGRIVAPKATMKHKNETTKDYAARRIIEEKAAIQLAVSELDIFIKGVKDTGMKLLMAQGQRSLSKGISHAGAHVLLKQ
jgi:hypothetical protein